MTITDKPSTKYMTKQLNYELSSGDNSTSFPLPFERIGGLPGDSVGGSVEVVFASCHDGMDGLLAKGGIGVEGELVKPLGPRLSKSALSDLTSC